MVAKKKKSTKAKKTTKAKKSTKSTKKKKTTAIKKKKTTKIAAVKKKTTTKKRTTSKKKTSTKKTAAKKATVKKSVKKTSRKSSKRAKVSAKTKKINYSEVDNQILDLLELQPEHILYFDVIETQFGFSVDEIKKACKRLENKNPPKITTKLVMENSKWITRIKKVENYGLDISPKKKSSKLVWNTANDEPCFICPYIKKCSDGQELYNPKSCAWLTDWLISTVNSTEPFTGNPFHPDYTSKKSRADSKAAAADAAAAAALKETVASKETKKPE